MKPTQGSFETPTTVRLRTGHLVTCIQDASSYVGHPFMTGWLSGVLYVSHDQGASWQASDIGFRTA
jgi:hypothetical protein